MSREPIILASSSPRRRQLLLEAGIDHEVVAPSASEDPRPRESARGYVLRCARAKAEEVSRRFPGRLVLAADTVVTLDGEVLGKPGSPERTRDMVKSLSGRTHEVLSGVVAIRREPAFVREAVVVSEVTFRPLTAAEIDAYVATGEGLDKAGGYGIQGRGSSLVAGHKGSLTSIVGLPLEKVREFLAEAAVPR